MADSVVEILNTTLTSTELPDSSTSYDLITTDANTSYVIKDVQVKTVLSNLDAEINNFPIGSFAQDLSGSEVVDVNSTLSVKSSDFPVVVSGVWWGNFDTPNLLSTETLPFVNPTLKGQNASHELENLTDLGFSGFINSQGINVINSFVLSSDKTKLFNMYTNGNQSQSLRYWATPQSSYTELITSGYAPMWYLPHKESIYYRNGNELNAINVETGTITTIGSNLLGFGANIWSNYFRWTSNGDWLFYIKDDGYGGTINVNNARVWATNVTNAVTLEFTACGGNSISVGTKMGVSYDAATDYYYLYRNDTATTFNLLQDRLPITKSQMDAYTSNTSISTSSLNSYKTNTFTSIERSNFSDTFTGHPIEGNKFYHIDYSSGAFKELNWDEESDNVVYIKENSGTKSFLTTYPLSAAEAIEVFGSDPASFKIRITGVKTTS